MIDHRDLVYSKALSVLRADRLSHVLVEPTTDSAGDDAWQVTIVLKSEEVSGDELLDLLGGLRRALVAQGDDRFPIVDFVTEDELAADVDSEA